MKIGFVNSIITENVSTFPIGLVSLCTILTQNNIECEIIDFHQIAQEKKLGLNAATVFSIDEMAKLIYAKELTLVSFYTMANSYHLSLLIAQELKKMRPDIIIIFAGPQVSACAYETMDRFDFIDLVALGEGEKTVLSTVKHAAAREFEKCPSSLYRKNNSIIATNMLPLIENLDDLPFLDYSFVPYIETYRKMPIEVGRGCPFSCKFCSTKCFWEQKYRLKSSNRIIAEIKDIIQKYGITEFNFEHDSLTASRKAIMSLCQQIKEQGLSITWGCSSRIDVLDEELIMNLSNAGCIRMFMGIETGSSRMQKKINKNLNLSKIRPTIQLLHTYGIAVTCSFIYGFPDETETDLCDTLALIVDLIQLGVEAIQIHKLSVLCGTELYIECRDKLNTINAMNNFNAGGNSKAFIEFIQDNPDIFPHFFEIDGILCNDQSIECFVNNILRVFSKLLKRTFSILLNFYDGNLYHLYEDMRNCCKFLELESYEVLNSAISNEAFLYSLLDAIDVYYFTEKSFGIFEYIKEVFHFEVDLVKWYRSGVLKQEKVYSYDILSYIKENEYSHAAPAKKRTPIVFCREGGKIYLEGKGKNDTD